MYELTIDYDPPGVGHTYWLFILDDRSKAMNTFVEQVRAFVEWNKRIEIKLMNDKTIIAQFKIN